MRFTRVDLPTLGRPTMATTGKFAVEPNSARSPSKSPNSSRTASKAAASSASSSIGSKSESSGSTELPSCPSMSLLALPFRISIKSACSDAIATNPQSTQGLGPCLQRAAPMVPMGMCGAPFEPIGPQPDPRSDHSCPVFGNRLLA